MFFLFLKKIMVPAHGWSSTDSRLQSHYEERVHSLLQSPQKFLVLIWSTSERWKAESTLESPSSFELKAPGLGIQHLNHYGALPLTSYQHPNH